jgi:GTP-binding protein HflX
MPINLFPFRCFRIKNFKSIDKVFGKTTGLKASQLQTLQKMYRRRVSGREIITHELTRQLASISNEIRKQVSLLITRKGEIAYVVVGDYDQILLPDLNDYSPGLGRLRGLRCVHTHLHDEALSNEDLTNLVLLSLDLMACIQVDENGIPGAIAYAHILPENKKGEKWSITRVADIGQLDTDFQELIQALESEFSRRSLTHKLTKKEKAILVGVTTTHGFKAKDSLNELRELARSNNLEVVDAILQHVREMNARFLIGKGKLQEIVLRALQTGTELLIFDNELTPAQVRSLTDTTDLKIIDRSQLILDIFARRAVTREGKIQVELAQLKYLLPRLATKNTAMSRLTGGIGGRGPGETKLEINRRRAYERITRLNHELEAIKLQRQERRRLRNTRGLPVLSIIGYTNAGKSTLLNTLTRSRVLAEDRLFATLDPSSKRLRFPREREVIITDTVGFIRDLPDDLMKAFAATLEELHDADLLLHVVDAGSPRMAEQIKTVEKILEQLELRQKPSLLLLNKSDLLDPLEAVGLAKEWNGIPISAINPQSLHPMLRKIEHFLWP